MRPETTCDHCGATFRPKRRSGKYCSGKCRRAAMAVRQDRKLPSAHLLRKRLFAKGMVGKVWPVYSWDTSPRIVQLLVPRNTAAAELGIPPDYLAKVLEENNIVDDNGRTLRKAVADFYQARLNRRVKP